MFEGLFNKFTQSGRKHCLLSFTILISEIVMKSFRAFSTTFTHFFSDLLYSIAETCNFLVQFLEVFWQKKVHRPYILRNINY